MDILAKTALVTGASRGIGRSIALALSATGHDVFFTYASKAGDAEETLDAITKAGGRAKAFQLNVADSAAVAAFFQSEIKDKVFLEVLVNNAGITKDGLILRMKDEDWDAVLDVNLRGAFCCLREAAKIMTKQRRGRIINISSVVGQMGNPGQINYVSSKAGLIGLTMSAAKELAARNITVNAVAPGFIETDMTSSLPANIQAQYLEHIPLRRFGSPEDVAEAVVFLASDKAGYITGQVLAVNGGMHC